MPTGEQAELVWHEKAIPIDVENLTTEFVFEPKESTETSALFPNNQIKEPGRIKAFGLSILDLVLWARDLLFSWR